MRPLLFATILCALILAACSTPQPTATPVPPTSVPVTAGNPTLAPASNALATLAATAGINLAQPGTLIIPTQGASPNAPTDAPIVFNNLTFSQSGGIADMSLTIQVSSNGTLIRNNQTGSVSQDDIQKLNNLLNNVHFFTLQGIFTGPSGAADAYQYSLTVNAAQGTRTISSQDGMTPPQLNQIYDAIRSLQLNGATVVPQS